MEVIENVLENLKKNDRTWSQLVRYTFVGGIAFIVDIGILIILTDFFAIHYFVWFVMKPVQ